MFYNTWGKNIRLTLWIACRIEWYQQKNKWDWIEQVGAHELTTTPTPTPLMTSTHEIHDCKAHMYAI